MSINHHFIATSNKFLIQPGYIIQFSTLFSHDAQSVVYKQSADYQGYALNSTCHTSQVQ